MLDLGELVLHIKTDTSEVNQKLGGLASQAKGVLGKVGGAAAATAKVVAAGTAAAAAGVTALTKASLDSYASYEQLVGGVETLFKDSARTVQNYADQAYKTSGMSANQYMSTVTSFSASMIKSLGGDTKAAAEMSNQAIIDMSDNANKMGTDITSIQNAYQGFAKQNYTMLDNLKLGYGGTKSEMERLIADANKVKEANGEMADLSIDSFADVTEAIHIIQTEMGITGTTAKEAATTIEGSVNSMKSAWGNWLTELGKENGDVAGKTKELVDSVVTVVGNIVPVIKRIVPNLLEALGSLTSSAVDYLTQHGPEMLAAASEWIDNLIDGITESIPKIVAKAKELIQSFVGGVGGEGGGLAQLKIKGLELVRNLIDGIVEAIPQIAEAAGNILAGLVSTIMNLLPQMV